MAIWKRKKPAVTGQVVYPPVQLRSGAAHPFGVLEGYTPLHRPEFALYRAIREAVPVVDAAIMKLVRLCGGVKAVCPDKHVEEVLNQFLQTIPTGWNQRGIQSFLDAYLDSLLTCGRAVGEMVLAPDGCTLAAVLCGSVEGLEIKERSPLELTLCRREAGGAIAELPYQDLLLFTPYQPTPENPYGQSLLHSMPFLSNVLLKIYQSLGINWERAGNLRFSVVYKPEGEGLDEGRTQQRAMQLASEWSAAMQSTKNGAVRDFVSVGDVEIRVIGAEAEIPDCQVPVRLIIEQLIAQTGIPPFMLGLNWSSTERMSSQQADIMTSELTALRRTLSPPVERICRLWLRLQGYPEQVMLDWEEINLQDSVEEAKALLYRQQAKRLELENKKWEEERIHEGNQRSLGTLGAGEH